MTAPDPTEAVITELIRRKLTVAVAESLTGGLLTAELIRPAGASATVLGGVVAYNGELKSSLLGVSATALSVDGAVNSAVAEQMAIGVRRYLAVGSNNASIGLATTGVAGPHDHEGVSPGIVYVGLSMGNETTSRRFAFSGNRDQVRAATVVATIGWLTSVLEPAE